MKKFVSIVLVIALVFSLSTVAFAANDETETSVMEIEGGHLYMAVSDTKTVTIATNNANHFVRIAIKYPNSDTVYEWSIENYTETFEPQNDAFWNEIIEIAESNINNANKVCIVCLPPQNETPIMQMSSGSASADLEENLEELEGNEYAWRLKYSNYDYSVGHDFDIYENMEFNTQLIGTWTWSDVLSVIGLITGVMGKVGVPHAKTISTICSVLGVAISAYSKVQPGKISEYICTADVYRYVHIDSETYAYNTTHKYISYYGYDNADSGSTERARIDESSRFVEWEVSESYFNDYDWQCEDAYAMYEMIN